MENEEKTNENEENRNENEEVLRRAERNIRWRSSLIWIIVLFVLVYFLIGGTVETIWFLLISLAKENLSEGVFYVLIYYSGTIFSILLLFLLCWVFRSNRYLWKSFLPPKRRPMTETDENDVLADFYGRRRNGPKMLGWGLLLGFLANLICIVCALIHGDIKLYFESAFRQIPVFLFALVSVLVQSTSEELWCRGFLYERIHERYPLWVAILSNGILFGLLHTFNDGVTVLSIINITVFGFFMSLLRWYTGSIWIVMGVHTAWNFTQAFLFGLPNSGLVSDVSLFHLNASTGMNNLIYNYVFGVEGALPALIVHVLLGAGILLLAARNGRLKELTMDRSRAMAAAVMLRLDR